MIIKMGSYFSKQKIEIKDEMSLSFLDYNNVQKKFQSLYERVIKINEGINKLLIYIKELKIIIERQQSIIERQRLIIEK